MSEQTHKRNLAKIRQSDEARRPFDLVWAECDDYAWGQQKLFREWDGSIVDATSLRPESRHIRDRYNLIRPRVMREHASYTALSPKYQVAPSPPVGSSPSEVKYQSAVKAALNAERQLSHFDVELDIPAVKSRVKQMAIVYGEGYVWADNDPSKGAAIPGTNKRIGRLSLRVASPIHVVWGQGQRFEESTWHGVKWFATEAEAKARWPKSAENIRADAAAHDSIASSVLDSGHGKAGLVCVWEYFERPNAASAEGCHYTYVGGECVFDEEYPYRFDETDDEPWLVRYFYSQPECKSRASGMVEDIIDANRAFNRRENTLSEWWGMAAQPMVSIPRFIRQNQDNTDIYPGRQWEKSPTGEGIEFVQPPPLPEWMQRASKDIQANMDTITGQYDFGNVASYSSPGSIQQIRQQDQNRQGEIARQFDRSDSALARRLLLLARKNYTEPRKVTFRSQTGEQTMDDFVASRDLPSTIDIEISSGVPASPAQNAAMVTQWGASGWTTPPEAMLAIQDNNPSLITEPIKLNIALQQRQNRTILELDPDQTGPIVRQLAAVAAEASGEGIDISQASPPPGPWPHASEVENQDICMRVMENWFLTPEYEMMDRANKQIAQWLYQERKLIKMADASRQAQLDAAQAQQMGAQNATRPSGEKPTPSQPSLQSQMPPEEKAVA